MKEALSQPTEWKKASEQKAASYFHIFSGGISPRSALETECPQMIPAVESLVRSGKIIGQDVFDETGQVDTLYHLNPNPSSEPIVVGPVGSPKGVIRNFHERK